jgi:hypothetical protein
MEHNGYNYRARLTLPLSPPLLKIFAGILNIADRVNILKK